MSVHDYSPQQALEILLQKVRNKDTTLADRIKVAIDEGKDINEPEKVKGRKQKTRHYRRKVAYTHDEALGIALDVLQAHFIELPLFINSAASDFKEAAIGIPSQVSKWIVLMKNEDEEVITQSEGESKQIQVELQTETQLSPTDQDIFSLEPVPLGQLDEQRSNFKHLRELVEF